MKKYVQSINKSDPSTLYVLIEVWNILSKEKNYTELKALAKIIYRMLGSPSVPSHLWIKGHIICAKTLIKNPTKPNYEDAITLLKNLCQVLPPLPLPDDIYSIQKNLKLNEPIRSADLPQDSLFIAGPIGMGPDMQSKPDAVKVVRMEPVVHSSASGMSIIDGESKRFINDIGRAHV